MAEIAEIVRSATCIGWSVKHAQATPTSISRRITRRMKTISGIRSRKR